MSCNCNKAVNTTSCIGRFAIGIGVADTAYQVYFRSPSGRTDMYPVTADDAGLITVETPRVRIGDIYRVWMNQPGDATEKLAPFIVGDAQVNCVNIEFTACFEDDEYIVPVDQTLQLEE